MAKLLGAHGVDVNLRGSSGSTAFDIANMIGGWVRVSNNVVTTFIAL